MRFKVLKNFFEKFDFKKILYKLKESHSQCKEKNNIFQNIYHICIELFFSKNKTGYKSH